MNDSKQLFDRIVRAEEKLLKEKIITTIKNLIYYDNLEEKINHKIEKIENFSYYNYNYINENDSKENINFKKIYFLKILNELNINIINDFNNIMNFNFIELIKNYLNNDIINTCISKDKLVDIQYYWN